MPFSFIEIEESKKKVIALLFIFLVFFYFFGALFLTATVRFIIMIRLKQGLSNPFLMAPKQYALIFLFALAHLCSIFANVKMELRKQELPVGVKGKAFMTYFIGCIEYISNDTFEISQPFSRLR